MVDSAHALSRRTVLTATAATALATAVQAGSAEAAAWPTEFPLPNGFQPEGIAVGRAPYAYMGSRVDGRVFRVDLRTGRGGVLWPGAAGLVSLGMKVDKGGLLYVAGGGGGGARVIDTGTGELVATHQFTATTGHFINDVVLTRDGAWFTDSRDSHLYALKGGTVRRLPLRGDWELVPDANNANGLVTTGDGRDLIVVSSTQGRLYRVDTKSGHATRIELVGLPDVVNGDGLVRSGSLLYVVQNRLNRIAVLRLDARETTATLTRFLTDPRFDVPSTAARHGNRLYLVNARFTTPPTPETTYNGVAVKLS
ncbi:MULTISPECIES: SMP-30/gluconolactonase/LRE family protein [unclassified Streptomyces]|uniref:SMP-30/gluconolactonase/LRE family protein n=1 Tax=unclassified Streptomyces TaxID=2593676 RepID=UPI002E197931